MTRGGHTIFGKKLKRIREPHSRRAPLSRELDLSRAGRISSEWKRITGDADFDRKLDHRALKIEAPGIEGR